MHSLPDRFQIVRTLGRGGMGELVVARDRQLDREVAIKFLHIEAEPRLRERFAREAQLLARFRSARFPEVYDFDAEAEVPWIALERIDGRNLEEDPPEDVVGTYVEVLEGLRELHAAQVIHRDVKPANILRTSTGRVALIDFGLAHSGDLERLTRTGFVVGTPAFLAPEVARGVEPMPTSDLFSWAVSCFLQLEDRLPFPLGAISVVQAGRDEPPVFERVDLNTGLGEALARCLELEPSRRPAGAAEVLALLDGGRSGAFQVTRATRPLEGASLPARGAPPRPPRGGPEAGPPRPEGAPGLLPGAALGFLVACASLLGLWALGLVTPGSQASPGPGPSPGPGLSPGPGAPGAGGPAPARASGPVRLEDLDLAGEIREAVVGNDPHGVQFMSRYRALGLGAFDLLPGQRAWLDWASTDGDLTQLSAEALGRIAAADAEAHRLGLVAPFGPAWDLRLHDELRAQPRAVLHRWIKEAGDLRWETERAIFKDPQSFPGVVDSPNPLYSPTAQLEYVMRRLPRDPELSRRWDVRMARERWMWRRVASLGSRAYAWIPVGEREKTYQRHVDLVGGFHLALFRAASGAALRRIMGFRPRTPEGKKIESLAARTLQYMAEVSDVVPAADDPGWVEGPEDG